MLLLLLFSFRNLNASDSTKNSLHEAQATEVENLESKSENGTIELSEGESDGTKNDPLTKRINCFNKTAMSIASIGVALQVSLTSCIVAQSITGMTMPIMPIVGALTFTFACSGSVYLYVDKLEKKAVNFFSACTVGLNSLTFITTVATEIMQASSESNSTL